MPESGERLSGGAEYAGYAVNEYEHGRKVLMFEDCVHQPPSVAELLKIVEKEFPGISLGDLEITTGDELFRVEKRGGGF